MQFFPSRTLKYPVAAEASGERGKRMYRKPSKGKIYKTALSHIAKCDKILQ
jgi:hypothetical protein